MKFPHNNHELRYLIYLGCLVVTVLIGIKFIKIKPEYKVPTSFIQDTCKIGSPIAKAKDTVLVVRGTCYNCLKSQTDNSPYTTADGFKINKKHPFKDKVAALSRELLTDYGGGPFSFGDTICVTGTWVYDGLWVVHDTGPVTMVNTIDLLVDSDMYMDCWKKVAISAYIAL